ncbi:hypothetical protein LACPH_002159 [Lacticaseibacillus parahuelsenbergensis]|uniref:Uncharacterized protein n=1 Tax=Lacticaseibacillus parahuelsenbergensis TaxID=3068305 RepID=A0ABY9L151_9LACO|nr:hypothetical protein [Lacticaseibacillus sp. NCIMB 15471]WLV77414.1 hypothetical protein LACPH_002159 [Lacticaseibacillus sp. NCIMB 15471]
MMMAVVCILIIMLAWIIGKVYHDTLVIKWLRKHRGPLTIVATLLVIFSQSRDLRFTALMMPGVVMLLSGIVLTIHDHCQKQRTALN